MSLHLYMKLQSIPPFTRCLPPSAAPSPTIRAALDSTYLRWWVNHRMPAEHALRSIIEPLLEKFRLLLLRDKWLAVCMQCMRVGQAVVDVLHTVPAENRSRSVQSSPLAGLAHGSQEHSTAEQVRGRSRYFSGFAV